MAAAAADSQQEQGLHGLLERLRHWAQVQPQKSLFLYADDRGNPEAEATYEQVEQRTRALAEHLLTTDEVQLQAGDRVLLVFVPSLDFVLTFLSCLRAGVIPVPVYPPNPQRIQQELQAFATIAASCGAVAALSHQQYYSARRLGQIKDSAARLFRRRAAHEGPAPEWPDIPWVLVDKWTSGRAGPRGDDGVIIDEERSDRVAFLQYTSGSTSAPKGVMVTHGNLHHNLATIIRALEAADDTVVVSWLPQYHDMGLIGSLCGTLYCGGRGVYISPLAFIQHPPLWVQLMSRYGATHVQSPNFGYLLTARKWLTREGPLDPDHPAVDLSSVRHMFNAAEPITAHAVDAFMEVFEPARLNPAAMAPGYGLAEHTVYVSDRGHLRVRIDRSSLERTDDEEEEQEDDNEQDGGGGGEERKEAKEERKKGKVLSSARVMQVWRGPRGQWEWKNERPTGESAEPSVHCPLTMVEEVGCGDIDRHADVLIAVVEPHSRRLLAVTGHSDRGEREPDAVSVGEVWLCSPSVASGYWGLEEATETTFRGQLEGWADDEREELPEELRACRWLRTGDLGFIWGRELFITGRQKDMLILRGRNYYPQDLEQTAEGVEVQGEAPSSRTAAAESVVSGVLRPGCTAAIAVPGSVVLEAFRALGMVREPAHAAAAGAGDGGGGEDAARDEDDEWLVIVGEYRSEILPRDARAKAEQLQQDAVRIARAVFTQHGLWPAAIFLFHKKGVRKTTSGKIARAWNVRAMRLLAEDDPRGPWQRDNKTILFAAPTSPAAQTAVLGHAVRSAHHDGGEGGGGGGGGEGWHRSAMAGECPVKNEEKPTVAGDELGVALRWELASILGVESDRIPLTMRLGHVGLDSQGFAQFKGTLLREYALEGLTEEAMFASGFTLQWIVDHADPLRRGEEVAPEGKSTRREEDGATAEESPPEPIVQPREPTKCERYCPCCLWCVATSQ